MKDKLRIKPRPYEYSLYPRNVLLECECEYRYVRHKMAGNPNPIEDCPTKYSTYLNYRLQFNQWFKERMKGRLVRYYQVDKFQYAKFQLSPLFKLIRIIQLIKRERFI